MNVKLTLRLDEKAVETGKRFAAQQNTSLSQLVQSYFVMLDNPDHEIIPVSQKLQSLIGIGSGTINETNYRNHLERKFS